MFNFLKKVVPHEEKFFDLFDAHAAKSLGAAKSLRVVPDGGKGVSANCTALMRQEDESGQRNEDGLKALYWGKGNKDPMAFIFGAEIDDHLEKVADRFEDAAHAMSGIVIEHV
jgi:hypothetical protein